MQAAIFLMAIMGCGEGEGACQQVRLLDTRYSSQAACSAATETAISRYADLDFPVVVAQCVAAGRSPALDSRSVALPPPEATPHFQGR